LKIFDQTFENFQANIIFVTTVVCC
jgi:hypothetical protein